jgi:hypothetical protein
MKCPNCQAPLPAVRIPKSWKEMWSGGWTCEECGVALDRTGALRDRPVGAGRRDDAVSAAALPAPPVLTAEQMENNRAAYEESERPLQAALWAYGAGLLPVILAGVFGSGWHLWMVLSCNLIGAAVATVRASSRLSGRLLFAIPAFTLTFGVSLRSWRYLIEAGSRTLVSLELLLPAIVGAVPGVLLWLVALFIHGKMVRKQYRGLTRA